MTKTLRFQQLLIIFCVLFLSACESTVMREFNHHMAGNDFRSAQTMLNGELSQNPNSAEANYLMGNLLSREKNYEEANAYFERSLSSSFLFREHIDYLKERNYRLELNEGLNAWEQENAQRTIQHLNYANQIFPDRIEVYPTLGNAYEAAQQPAEAQRTYRRCLALDAENFQCGLNLAVSLFINREFSDAITFVSEFNEYYSTNPNLLKILAYSYLETGDPDKAEETFDKFLAVGFNYEAVKQFANELNNMGEIYRAEKYFTRCLEQRPRDRDVLNALSYIYLETGNFRLMVQANERLVSMEPENRLLLENLMLSYELYGDIDNYRLVRIELGLD